MYRMLYVLYAAAGMGCKRAIWVQETVGLLSRFPSAPRASIPIFRYSIDFDFGYEWGDERLVCKPREPLWVGGDHSLSPEGSGATCHIRQLWFANRWVWVEYSLGPLVLNVDTPDTPDIVLYCVQSRSIFRSKSIYVDQYSCSHASHCRAMKVSPADVRSPFPEILLCCTLLTLLQRRDGCFIRETADYSFVQHTCLHAAYILYF